MRNRTAMLKWRGLHVQCFRPVDCVAEVSPQWFLISPDLGHVPKSPVCSTRSLPLIADSRSYRGEASFTVESVIKTKHNALATLSTIRTLSQLVASHTVSEVVKMVSVDTAGDLVSLAGRLLTLIFSVRIAHNSSAKPMEWRCVRVCIDHVLENFNVTS